MKRLKSLSGEEYLQYALHLAVLIGVAWAAARYLNGQEVLNALKSFNYRLAPPILLIATTYLLIKAWRFVLLMQPFDEGIPWFVTFKAYIAGQAATLLPGGVAARAGLMKQVNIPVEMSGVSIAFSSGIDQVIFIAGLLVAAFWFEVARAPALTLLGVITAVSLLLAIPTARRWLAGAASWVAKKFKIKEKWHTFLEAIPQVLTWRIMLLSFGLTLVAFAGQVIILDFAMRGVNLEIAYPTLFLGFILPTMLGRIVPVPGGVGVTEASMVGFFTAVSQAGPNQLTAAVAIFRVATLFFPTLLGAIVYFTLWSGSKETSAHPSS